MKHAAYDRVPMTPGRCDADALCRFADALDATNENGREAYVRVWGPFPEGMSPREQTFAVGEILKHPWLIAERDRRRKTGLRDVGVTPNRVIQELAAIAFLDPRKLVRRERAMNAAPNHDDVLDAPGEEGTPGKRRGRPKQGTRDDGTMLSWRELDELDEATARAIASIEPVFGGGYRVKFWSKIDALRALAEMTGALTPREQPTLLTTDELTDDELALMLLELEGPQAGGPQVGARDDEDEP